MTTSWAEFFQSFSSPVLDKIVYAITSIGSEVFYAVALSFVYWVWDKRKGYRLSIVFLSSMFVNGWLKFLFGIPRPIAYGNLRVIYPETGGGFSFPSGHAQGTTTFWGWLSYEIRRKWFSVLAVVVIALVSVSRIYLNVHWPIDIVGGFLIVLPVIVFWKLVFDNYDENRWPVKLRFAFSVLLPLSIYLLYPKGDSSMLTGLILGLPLGRYLEENYLMWNEKAAPKAQIAKIAVGAMGYAVLRYGLKVIFSAIYPGPGILDVVRYALVALWISYGAPFVFVKFGWQGQ